MIDNHLISRLCAIVGEEYVSSDARTLRQGSQDFYWFSPILKPLLAEKQADVIVRPGSVDELIDIIRLGVEAQIPLTMRGAGTGNYGQGIPMQVGSCSTPNGWIEFWI